MPANIKFFRNPIFDYTLTGLLLIQLFLIPLFPIDANPLLFNLVGTLIYINLVLVIKEYKDQIALIVFVLFVLQWVLFFTGHDVLSTISSLLNIILFLNFVTVFILSLARSNQVDIKIIFHAINGYLLLGVIAGIGVEVIMLFNSHAISFPIQDLALNNGDDRLGVYQYFGLSTLTTLGYGDIIPLSPIARSFATFITMTGQMYLTIIIAMLVGKYLRRKE